MGAGSGTADGFMSGKSVVKFRMAVLATWYLKWNLSN